MHDLQRRLPCKITGVSAFDKVCLQSDWHKITAGSILENMLAHHSQSHFNAKHQMRWKNYVGRTLLFLHDFVALRNEHCGLGDGTLCWFLNNCTSEMALDAGLALLQNIQVHNECETEYDVHFAQNAASKWVSFVKHGIGSIQPDNESLQNITARQLLRSVPNKRVPAEGTTRRTFNQSELDALLESCKCDTRHTLVIILLREIGLRVSCLANMKYSMLLDDSHTPRHICRVPEKKKTWRSFVTSTALKQAIKNHAEMLRKHYNVNNDFYIFNTDNPTKPACTQMIQDMVKRVAEDAQISDVNVHAHAFRHTIVGELMDAGNSMDVVSKYMGHASVSTTAKNYWVPTVTELYEKLQNPFTGTLQQQAQTEEQLQQDNNILRVKLDACLRLLRHQNVVFRTAASNGGTAEDALKQFHALAPDAETILRAIVESSASRTESSNRTEPNQQRIQEYEESCGDCEPVTKKIRLQS